jgi:hypothetical protein
MPSSPSSRSNSGLLHLTLAIALAGTAAACADARATSTPPAAQAEVERIQRHLAAVEAEMRAADVSHLDTSQQMARRVHLDRLNAYREAGVFPHNHVATVRVPFFIDEHGTRCAMAHLIESSGGGGVVARVAKERNSAYVRELTDEPELVAWLDQNGISLAEAARVQPTYMPEPDPEAIRESFLYPSIAANVAGGAAMGMNVRDGAGKGAGWFGVAAGAAGAAFHTPAVFDDERDLERTVGIIGVGVGIAAAALGVRTLMNQPGPGEVRARGRGRQPTVAITAAPVAGGTSGLALVSSF